MLLVDATTIGRIALMDAGEKRPSKSADPEERLQLTVRMHSPRGSGQFDGPINPDSDAHSTPSTLHFGISADH